MDRDGEGRLQSGRRSALAMLVVLAIVAAADLARIARRRRDLEREVVARYVDRVLRAAGES